MPLQFRQTRKPLKIKEKPGIRRGFSVFSFVGFYRKDATSSVSRKERNIYEEHAFHIPFLAIIFPVLSPLYHGVLYYFLARDTI